MSSMVDIAGNSPLALDDGASVWFVRSGTVQVFAVPVSGGDVAGARQFLLECAGAGALFSAAGDAAEHRLIAVPVGPARLERHARSDLLGAGMDAESIAAELDRWVAALGGALADGAVRPRRWLALSPGRGWLVGSGQGAIVESGVLWCGAAHGRLRFLSVSGLPPVEGEARLPIHRGTWLTAMGDACVDAAPTAELVASGAVWEHADGFHRTVLALAAHHSARVRHEQEARARTRGDREAMHRERAYSSLLAAFAPAAELPLGQSLDPLWACCRLVWQAAGIDVPEGEDQPLEDSGTESAPRLADALGIRHRAVTLAGAWWRGDSGPLLGSVGEGGHPVALLPVPGGYERVDPARKERAPVTEAVAATLSPRAYMFYRSFPPVRLGWPSMLRHSLKGAGADARRLLGYTCAASALALVAPLITGELVDTVIPAADRSRLAQAALALVAAAACGALFELVRGIAMVRLQGRLASALQAAMMDRLLSLPVDFFRDFTAGELADRAGAVTQIRDLLSGAAVSGILSVVTVLSGGVVLVYYDRKLALAAFACLAALVVAATALTVRKARVMGDVTAQAGRLQGLVLQLVSGVLKLKVAGAEERAFLRWSEGMAALSRGQLSADRLSGAVAVLNGVFPVAASLALFATAAWVLDQPPLPGKPGEEPPTGLTPGAFIGFVSALGGISAALAALFNALAQVVQCVPLMRRTRPIVEAVPEVDRSKHDPGELTGTVRVDRVTFRYRADGPPVLDGVSFAAQPGEFVALVGPSGSGKSTLIRLLLGFERPESGTIEFDGRDMAWLDVRALRRQIGTVLQSGKIMAGSIQSNILGSSRRTVDDAWAAARMAGLAEDIEHLPMGMHTVLPQGATTLSGGQRQRLLIARALVRQPRILVFDEATSALDNRTQAIVSQSLARLRVTRIVIAHRLSTIAGADRIVVIDAGRVVESGSYDALMAQDGVFAELARRQLVE